MKKIGRSAKQMSGLALTVALLAGGLVPSGRAQERTVKQSPASNKDFEAESHAPDPPGKIAFASDRDGNFEIYTMNADGGGLTRVTDNPAEDTHPTWSPDGSRLAFVSNRDGNKEIYVVSAEGGEVTRLTNNTAEDLEPAWSPALTNQKIAFVSHRDGNDEVYVMNADGTLQTNLTNNTADDTGPAWAPSATLLSFASNRDGDKFEIYRMGVDGTNQSRLTNNSFNDVSTSWPPGRISFQSDRDGNDEIYTMNAGDGTNQTRITNNAAFDLDPARSSDGSRVVWVSNRDGVNNLEIYTANADGSNVVRLTNNAASDIDPAVQPLPSAATLGTIQLSASTYSIDEGQGSVSITVTRTGGSGGATVDFDTVSGTASERSDFTPVFRTITFLAGETSKTVSVAIVDDAHIENDETFGVTLSNPTGAVLGSPNTATVTIVDNDTSPAISFFGVTAANSLVRFSSATPGTLGSTVAITGLQAAETVLGIDVRPATLQLYILGSTGRLYTLDPGTGVATQVGTGTFALTGTSFGFDFNPVPDRIRVTSDADQNLRLNPDTGAIAATDTTLAYATGDPNAGQNPNVVGSAYTNNFAGAATTTLYDIDSARDILVTQNPPNNGTLNTVGALGVDTSDVVGFDIVNPSGTAYAALRVGGKSQLYTINLTTGAATLVGDLGGTSAINGITAVNPAPNPIDEARFFVRQLYLDILNREPDGPGLAFWTDNIEKCFSAARRPAGQTVAQCIDKQRESTAIAFFMSPEFQMTGGFVYRLYKGSLTGVPNYDGGSPGRFPTFVEFVRDVSQVSEGIVVNNQIVGTVVEANRNRLVADFVQRPEFVAKYGGLNNTLYVQELFNTTGITPTAAEKQALVDGLTNGTETRASVLRKVVDGTVVIGEGNVQFTTTYGQAFFNQESRRLFVYLEYVGFLRRNPDSAGFIFWLGKLNQFNGDPFLAEMVRSFILSPEYRSRFGRP